MKGIVIPVLYVGLAFGMSCKGKSPLSPLNCASNAQKVVDAGIRYSQDPTSVANCEAYKKEVVAFIKSCPAYYSGVEKQDLEEFANAPCN